VSDISDMRKSLNEHLDEIEKQTVEEMVSVEHFLLPHELDAIVGNGDDHLLCT
jgi:beta-glucosidase/6-phospho-beta-glucosidase/beta-galactosidase